MSNVTINNKILIFFGFEQIKLFYISIVLPIPSEYDWSSLNGKVAGQINLREQRISSRTVGPQAETIC